MNNGKNLKNKFGEALYKSELMFDKIMNKQMAKVDEEIFRSTLVYDSASLVFLNRIRNKRTKWIAEDKRYRDYYKVDILTHITHMFLLYSEILENLVSPLQTRTRSSVQTQNNAQIKTNMAFA